MSEATLYFAIYGFAAVSGIVLAWFLMNRADDDFSGRGERPKRWRDM